MFFFFFISFLEEKCDRKIVLSFIFIYSLSFFMIDLHSFHFVAARKCGNSILRCLLSRRFLSRDTTEITSICGSGKVQLPPICRDLSENRNGARIIERSNLTRIMSLSGKGHGTRIACEGRLFGAEEGRSTDFVERRPDATSCERNEAHRAPGIIDNKSEKHDETSAIRILPPEGSFDGGRINIKRETTQIKSSKRKRDRRNYIVDTLCLSLLRALFHKKENFSQKIPISLFCRTVLNLIARLLLFAGD